MTTSEKEFLEWKVQMRKSAMEKEVERLRNTTKKQSYKINTLRKILYFLTFFFLVLFIILTLKGYILFPSQENVPLSQSSLVDEKKKETKDLAQHINSNNDLPPTPQKGISAGVNYSVQIGAYTGIDLEKYKDNLVLLNQDSFDGINQFTLAHFNDYKQATDFLEIIKQMGFKDAFIMSFIDGKRSNIQDAIAISQKEQTSKTQAPTTSRERIQF
ncbi:hypothetical protein DMA11_19435 [Marinilabiliaceae bacterium JC017]|nr:hypothetical protein DMA11_19435 [Marinilabiliaceae bacterium JC017]